MNTFSRQALPLIGLALAAGLALPARADIEITAGWARETVPGATVGAGYFTVRNTGKAARRLLAVSSPTAAQVTVHEGSVDAQGVARMRPVASLALAAGQSLRFEPGGHHLMFEGLKVPFKVGSDIPVTFQFSNGEKPIAVRLQVRSLMDTGEHQHEHQHEK